MSTTPEALADAYRGARERIRELCSEMGAEEAERTVPTCPDWSVRDLLSHLTVIAAEPVAGNVPGDDVDAWMADGMAARGGSSAAELLDEWDQAGPAFEEIIRSFGAGLRNVVYDVGCHEHDLRLTLGRPGARDTDVVEIGLEALVDQLADRVREQGLPAAELVDSDTGRRWTCGDGEPRLSVTLPRFELYRMLADRRSRAQVLAAPWDGDVEPYLPALEASPFAPSDIDE